MGLSFYLSFYLPYKLKIVNTNKRTLNGCKTDNYLTLNGIRDNSISFTEVRGFYELNDFYNFKPILKPLTSLNEYINILSDMLINTDKCNFDKDFAKEWILQLKVTELPFFIVQKLF